MQGGPATTSGWAVDSVASKCVATVVGGAVVGALIGAVAGGGNRVVQGAALGTVAGAGLCVVIMALDAEDRARIKSGQLLAAQTNEQQILSYSGKDGLQRDITVRPTRTVVVTRTPNRPGSVTIVGDISSAETDDQATLAEGQMLCRELQTDASVATKGTAAVPPQIVCRQPDGSYAPQTLVASTS